MREPVVSSATSRPEALGDQLLALAVPVLVVALILAYSAKSVSKTYTVLSKIEW